MGTVATIGKIVSLVPIEGADRIVSAEAICGRAGRWTGVVQKGQFEVGNLCEVYLQDCIVPNTERFAFMEKSKFIVRMSRFRGAPSECLIMPLTIGGEIGDDISTLMGCEKYSKPLPANMSGDALGNFPTHLFPKTDEPLFQSVPYLVQALVGNPYYVSVKVDGSSATCFKHEGHFGCCSRNLELKETPNNAIWQIARKYDLDNQIPDGMSIQFEVCGPSIQGNPMGLKQVEPRLFNIYSITERRYLDYEDVFHNWAKAWNFPTVELIEVGYQFSDLSNEELRIRAEGLYPNGKQREGIVIRSRAERYVRGDRLSFKVVNLKYKGG
jgi:RNA ligase (TIGR02306 family)